MKANDNGNLKQLGLWITAKAIITFPPDDWSFIISYMSKKYGYINIHLSCDLVILVRATQLRIMKIKSFAQMFTGASFIQNNLNISNL